MNNTQAKLITRLVNLNYIITLHSIGPEYIFLSIACIDESFIPMLETICYPTRCEFWYTGDRVAGRLYTR